MNPNDYAKQCERADFMKVFETSALTSFDYKNFEDFCLNNYIAKYMVSYTSRMQGATNTDACRRIAVSVSFAVKCSSPYGVCYKSPISGTSCFGMANY